MYGNIYLKKKEKKEKKFSWSEEQNVYNVNRECVTNDESGNNVLGRWFVMLCEHFLVCYNRNLLLSDQTN